MKFDYLTNDSEKSLAPFFSPPLIKATLNSILIVAGLLLVFWPWQNFVNFIGQNKVPLTFFKTFTVTLIIISYTNLRCGRGEMATLDYYTKVYYRKEIATYEKEHDFFRYGLIEFILHSAFLMSFFFPFLILSASVSGISWLVFLKACSVVFSASLLCRMLGFLVYLLLGQFSSIGYFFTRIFLLVFLFATLTLAPIINPILNLYELNNDLQSIGFSFKNSYPFYMVTVLATLVFLIIMSQLLIKHHMKQEKAA